MAIQIPNYVSYGDPMTAARLNELILPLKGNSTEQDTRIAGLNNAASIDYNAETAEFNAETNQMNSIANQIQNRYDLLNRPDHTEGGDRIIKYLTVKVFYAGHYASLLKAARPQDYSYAAKHLTSSHAEHASLVFQNHIDIMNSSVAANKDVLDILPWRIWDSGRSLINYTAGIREIKTKTLDFKIDGTNVSIRPWTIYFKMEIESPTRIRYKAIAFPLVQWPHSVNSRCGFGFHKGPVLAKGVPMWKGEAGKVGISMLTRRS